MEPLEIMNRQRIRIRFDGPDLADHSIDVALLGPALTGLGSLLESANEVVNGGSVKTRVQIKADIQANCVTLDFEVIQGFVDSFRNLLGNSDVRTAKEIFEWLGIISGAGGFSVWAVYRWIMANRKPGQDMKIEKQDNSCTISISGTGNQIHVDQQVLQIARNPEVQESFRRMLRPLKSRGIDKVTFVGDSDETVITREEASAVLQASPGDIGVDIHPQTLRGHITIHSPTFDATSKKWKFKWNSRVETIDISQTDIADQVMQRGMVRLGDAFEVEMEVIEKKLKTGYKQYFKVIRVIAFKPNDDYQRDIPFGDAEENDSDDA